MSWSDDLGDQILGEFEEAARLPASPVGGESRYDARWRLPAGQIAALREGTDEVCASKGPASGGRAARGGVAYSVTGTKATALAPAPRVSTPKRGRPRRNQTKSAEALEALGSLRRVARAARKMRRKP